LPLQDALSRKYNSNEIASCMVQTRLTSSNYTTSFTRQCTNQRLLLLILMWS